MHKQKAHRLGYYIWLIAVIFSLALASPVQAQEGRVSEELFNLYQPHKADTQQDDSKPHRSALEMGTWLGGVVIEALDIKADNARGKLRAVKPYFSNNAYREFLTFLSEQSYWLFIDQRKYDMQGISVRLPSLLCQQSINGLFTWLFEVPVIVTLNETARTPNPSGREAREIVNLKIRIVRVPSLSMSERNPHQVLIENWRLVDESDVLNEGESNCLKR